MTGVPDDLVLRWADTSARLAAALRGDVSRRELLAVATPHMRASVELAEKLAEIADEEERGKPRLHLVGGDGETR